MTPVPLKQIAVAFFTLASSAAVAAPIDPLNYKQPIRVACVGGSITQGGCPGIAGINEPNIKIEIQQIDSLAKEMHLDVLDMHAVIESKPELLPDRLHPNTVGLGLMAAGLTRP